MDRARIEKPMKKFSRVLKDKKAQQVSEYAILIALALAAIFGMQLYVKRGFQARYLGAVKSMGRELRNLENNSQISIQYEPYYQKSQFVVTEQSSEQTNYLSFKRNIIVIPPVSSNVYVKGQTSISSQSSKESRGKQELLSGNYGD